MPDDTQTRRIVLKHAGGLHLRPCLAVVNTTRRFRSKVTVEWDGRSADASDVLQLVTLVAPDGAELVFSASGPDAAQVLDALERVFREDFGMAE